MRMILANGKTVKVTMGEIKEFITAMPTPIPNPDWRHSGLLTEAEWERYLKGESTRDELKKLARYILIYMENLSFTGYLFDKANGEPELTKEFNMPAVETLRAIYRRLTEKQRTVEELASGVHVMENLCLKIGADPL